MIKNNSTLDKSPTGIHGFDDICEGGLPKYRSTLICGSPGTGKSIFGAEFLANGIRQFDDPGVLISFEERAEDIRINLNSLGMDLAQLEKQQKLKIINVVLDKHTMEQSGDYDLEGLFIRIGAAIDSVGAKRVVLDAVENLFSVFSDQTIMRSEFKRLLDWLKDKQITAVITTEQGSDGQTRRGIEEYLSDCVITLQQRVEDQTTTRILRVVKYRGTCHGSDEYPFLIDKHGIVCMPINSMKLDYPVSRNVFLSGIASLDEMLGEGIYYGSTVLISGASGSGKSTLAAHYADASCSRGEKTLYFAMEESPDQIIRNMQSVGVNLGQWVENGSLEFVANRPSSFGLEMHLAVLLYQIERFKPNMVVIDPISSFRLDMVGPSIQRMFQRIIDSLKANGITSVFTSLSRSSGGLDETSSAAVSSLMDTWILLRNLESRGERTRGLYVIKSRGHNHSHQIREFVITDEGLRLEDVVINDHGEVLTGSQRQAKLLQDQRHEDLQKRDAEQLRTSLKKRREEMDAQIVALKEAYLLEEQALEEKLRNIDDDNMTARKLNEKVSVARSRGQL